MHFLSRRKKTLHLLFLVIGFSKLLLFYTSFFNTFPTEKLKSKQTDHFFSVEILDLIDVINAAENDGYLTLLISQKIKVSYHLSFYKLLILLSGDVSQNPGPCQVNSLWSPFKLRGLHFLHLNINSLFPKIDELREISKKTNAAFIGITETKLDSSILNPEIRINNYVLLIIKS